MYSVKIKTNIFWVDSQSSCWCSRNS